MNLAVKFYQDGKAIGTAVFFPEAALWSVYIQGEQYLESSLDAIVDEFAWPDVETLSHEPSH